MEIGDYGWEDAEAYFDELWAAAIPISELDERRRLSASFAARPRSGDISHDPCSGGKTYLI